MQIWTDETSYAQGEREQHVEPRVWNLKLGHLRVRVHRWHGINDAWFLSCDGFCDKRPLKAKTVQDAQLEAIELLRDWLWVALNDASQTEVSETSAQRLSSVQAT